MTPLSAPIPPWSAHTLTNLRLHSLLPALLMMSYSHLQTWSSCGTSFSDLPSLFSPYHLDISDRVGSSLLWRVRPSLSEASEIIWEHSTFVGTFFTRPTVVSARNTNSSDQQLSVHPRCADNCGTVPRRNSIARRKSFMPRCRSDVGVTPDRGVTHDSDTVIHTCGTEVSPWSESEWKRGHVLIIERQHYVV